MEPSQPYIAMQVQAPPSWIAADCWWQITDVGSGLSYVYWVVIDDKLDPIDTTTHRDDASFCIITAVSPPNYRADGITWWNPWHIYWGTRRFISFHLPRFLLDAPQAHLLGGNTAIDRLRTTEGRPPRPFWDDRVHIPTARPQILNDVPPDWDRPLSVQYLERDTGSPSRLIEGLSCPELQALLDDDDSPHLIFGLLEDDGYPAWM